MLDQDTKKPLDRSEQRAMDHHGPMRFVVFTDVFKLKSFRQIEIPLHGAKLPQTANRIFDLEIDFWAIESCLAFNPLVFNSTRLETGRQSLLCLFPIFFQAEIVFARIASLY